MASHVDDQLQNLLKASIPHLANAIRNVIVY